MNHKRQFNHDSLYARLFARIYNPVMRSTELAHLLKKRKALLSEVRGKVLEIGVGTGANLPLYPAEAELLAIEPSSSMLKYARKLLESGSVRAKVQLMQAGIEDAQVAEAAPDEGYDFIVSTLVLCTVPNQEAAIRQIRAWLKPEGRLLVLEHIQDGRQPHRWIQRAITPVWKRLGEGCHLDRPTDKLLKENGFRAVQEQYFTQWLPFYWAILEPVRR